MVFLIPGFLALSACGAGESTLRTRAAFDLKCDEAKLQVTDLGGGGLTGGGTKGVRGCGREATYVYSPNGNTWVLNSDSTPATTNK